MRSPVIGTDVTSYLVDAESAGVRLDSFLASQVADWSRWRLSKLIESEDVLVNGKPSKPSYKLRLGDEIEVEFTAGPVDRWTAENIPLDIVYEDNELIVIDKPAGMVVHPAAGVHSGTLVNALSYHFQQLPSVGNPSRPGIVHRLDKDTSGLLVVAKTDSVLENLADQFRERKVFKSYQALVHGSVKTNSGEINQPIARDSSNRTRMAVVPHGRSALSLYKVRRRFDRFTLLDINLKTGRTHQIRVHLAWLKHPVVGDPVYGGGRENSIQDVKIRTRVRNLSRQFLHSEKLGFTHPMTNQWMQFESSLPIELQTLLNELASKD